MNESEFIRTIDANFPYNDSEQAIKLIQEGISISDNASFMILHELCRIPKSVKVSHDTIFKLIEYWDSNYTHPIKSSVLKAAKCIVNNKLMPIENCIEIIREVKNYKNQYNALSILYFSCDDKDGLVETEYEKTISYWHSI